MSTCGDADQAPSQDLVRSLRSAVGTLESKYRLPISLCYEQGMSRREAADILDMPESTLGKHINAGLERLRRALVSAGHSVVPAALLAGLEHTAPAVPSSLAARLMTAAAARASAQAGLLNPRLPGARAAAAAKGGAAMKVAVWVVVSGAVAAALGVSQLGGSAGLPAAAPPEEPAPINAFAGAQQREEVFEFAQKPKVEKAAASGGEGKYVITFASKAKCDATVAIVAPDGKIVRHLASGVLGANAPHPFQPGSLSQKIEWDGKDDQGEKAPGGCKVRVSLGLKPEFEMNIGYDPGAIPSGTGGSQLGEVRDLDKAGNAFVTAKGPGGEVCVLGAPYRACFQGRVFKDGKYVRTFWPASAKDLEKLEKVNFTLASTEWGDKALVTEGSLRNIRDPRKLKLEEMVKGMFEVAGLSGQKAGPRPGGVPAQTLPGFFDTFFDSKQHRMAVDRSRDELYIYPARGLTRIDGKTGKVDETWFPDGSMGRISEVCVGPEGNVHISTGAHMYGQFVSRLTRDGKIVNFAGDAVPIPTGGTWTGGGGQYGQMEGQKIYGGGVCPSALKKMGKVMSLWTGHFGHSNTHERGMYVSPKGYIVHAVQYPWAERALKYGVPKDAPVNGDKVQTSYIAVWDKEGKLLTANAVGDMQNGHGVAMDADGNVFAAMGGRVPDGQKNYWGLTDRPLKGNFDHGSLLKFRGGKPFPRGRAHYGKEAPAGAAKLRGYRSGLTAIEGAEWIFGGLMNQTPDICSCYNLRYDMDYFARHWLPANQIHSIVVLDANANVVARLGRYGNVDDTDEDVKAGKDGLRFVWPRAVAVSDSALYVADPASRRILKAKISYAAEEEVVIP